MPVKSLDEFIAMEEAKRGKSTLGISKKVGADFVAATPRSALKGLPRKVKRKGAFAGPGEGLAQGHKKGEPPNLDKTYIPAKAAKRAGRGGGSANEESSELVDDPKEEARERGNAVKEKRSKDTPAFGIMSGKSKAQWFGKDGGKLR